MIITDKKIKEWGLVTHCKICGETLNRTCIRRTRRGKKAVTCSPLCSKKYIDLRRKKYNQVYKKIRKERYGKGTKAK